MACLTTSTLICQNIHINLIQTIHSDSVRKMLCLFMSAMHTAAAAGHASTVRLLLLAGGSALVETTDLSKRTPLSRACEMGRAAVVETLIDSGAKVNDVKDQDGQSMLHWFVLVFHALLNV